MDSLIVISCLRLARHRLVCDLTSGSNDEAGNVISGGRVEIVEAENSLVRNDGDVPVAVIGLDNVVVINTKHGILVARKDISQKVKEVVKRLEADEAK
jgi:hypothetical protein